MTPGWRRLVWGAGLGLVVVAAVAVATAGRLHGLPAWGTAVLAGLAVAGGLVLDPLKKLIGEWIEQVRGRRRALKAHLRMRGRDGRPRRVRDCRDAVALGVHPATTEGGGARRQPRYVRRDAHDTLRRAFEEGGLVVIEGRSAAGKSRLAYEAMHAYAPDRWLVVPETPEALRELRKAGVALHRAVVWLDDLERYLAAGGLDGGVLDALCPPGRNDVLLLATLRAEARRELTAVDLDSSVRRAAEEVLHRARTVSVPRDLSPDERARAERNRDDPRIAAALDQADQETAAGFAEYLAAGPAALERWRSARDGAHPLAGAIISAAVDARRAGFITPIPANLLEVLYEHYLAPRDRRRHAGSPAFAAALAWAAEPVRGASGCLNAADGGRYDPFDYLTDHAQSTSPATGIPATVWTTVLAYASPQDAYPIAYAAYQARRLEVSEAGYRRAAAAGHATAMNNLAVLLDETGRTDDAEGWWRRAIDAGHITAMRNLGNLMKRQDRTGDAEAWYRRAIDAGHISAMHNLAILLDETGRAEEARAWWRRAADAGHYTAMHELAVRLRRDGPTGEAEEWWRRAAEAGHAAAMRSLGNLLYATGRGEEAETWWRRAADAGMNTTANLGDLLRQTGRTQEAEALYRRAAEDGDATAIRGLAALLRETGRAQEAARWQRRAGKEAAPEDA